MGVFLALPAALVGRPASRRPASAADQFSSIRCWKSSRRRAICAGFPCQDVSIAGRGAGIDGSRTGLWRQVVRLAEELAPRLVILENVFRIRSRGLEPRAYPLARALFHLFFRVSPCRRTSSFTPASTDRQDEQSIETQIELGRALAAERGWNLIEIYEDRAVSGTKLKSRPGIQQVLRRIKQRDVDILLCVSVDRISRDMEHSSGILKLT